MKIGIDARLINETGVGRYIRNLVEQLGMLDKKNEYVVFLTGTAFDSFVLPNNRWQKRLADVRWHTIREQIVMPQVFLREKLDLVHIPYFNVPILYPKAFVVTIHDLTILHFNTGRATTLPWVLYQLRRLGYWVVHAVGLARAKKILAVSNATKQELIDHFRVDPNKIVVTYEGVDKKVKSPASPAGRQKSEVKSGKPLISMPYFLYVGNAYPHKNLEALIRAFLRLTINPPRRQAGNQQLTKLVLVGKEDYFYRRLRQRVYRLNHANRIKFFGEANDEQLANLYTHAIALVFPSLMEGFGLPTLEALANDCPILCSDIPVFHEILGDVVSYFDPHSVSSITQALTKIAHGEVSKPGSDEVKRLLSKYSWEPMALQTQYVYENTRKSL